MSAGHQFQPTADSAATQCAKVLQRLRQGPASTAELRAILGIASSPAARILQLRQAHTIHTIKTTVGGAVVACYVLQEGEAP